MPIGNRDLVDASGVVVCVLDHGAVREGGPLERVPRAVARVLLPPGDDLHLGDLPCLRRRRVHTLVDRGDGARGVVRSWRVRERGGVEKQKDLNRAGTIKRLIFES